MGQDYSTFIYSPNFDFWGRPVTFYPLTSQPTVPSYDLRGIFSTRSIDIISQDGSDISEQQTILDILEREFSVLPAQQDLLFIPDDPSGMPAEGWWEVNDVSPNGGGETTLVLRRWMPPRPST